MAQLTDEKSAVGSVGVWGSGLAFIVGLLQIVQDPVTAVLVPPAWRPYLIAAGAVAALIGRVTAKKQITSVMPKSTEPPTV